jgi:hypothetical protein
VAYGFLFSPHARCGPPSRVAALQYGGEVVSKSNGFLQLRRGLWEHVRDGRMSITEALTFIYICSEADTRTGIWKGSAKSLSGELGIPERTARDVLEKMEHGDYIRRFAVPGRHACYPILVHKFLITDGEHDGEHLNAIESTNPVDLRYFPPGQNVEEDGEHGVERGAAQKRIENRERRTEKEPRCQKAAPGDPRFQPFFAFAFESFAVKHKRNPLWQGKDFSSLKRLLKGQSAELLPLERLTALWRSFLDSTDAFIVKQGDSLAYFCSNIDKFSDGPMLAAPGKGTNGKPTATDLAMRNAAGLGLHRRVN